MRCPCRALLPRDPRRESASLGEETPAQPQRPLHCKQCKQEKKARPGALLKQEANVKLGCLGSAPDPAQAAAPQLCLGAALPLSSLSFPQSTIPRGFVDFYCPDWFPHLCDRTLVTPHLDRDPRAGREERKILAEKRKRGKSWLKNPDLAGIISLCL